MDRMNRIKAERERAISTLSLFMLSIPSIPVNCSRLLCSDGAGRVDAPAGCDFAAQRGQLVHRFEEPLA